MKYLGVGAAGQVSMRVVKGANDSQIGNPKSVHLGAPKSPCLEQLATLDPRHDARELTGQQTCFQREPRRRKAFCLPRSVQKQPKRSSVFNAHAWTEPSVERGGQSCRPVPSLGAPTVWWRGRYRRSRSHQSCRVHKVRGRGTLRRHPGYRAAG